MSIPRPKVDAYLVGLVLRELATQNEERGTLESLLMDTMAANCTQLPEMYDVQGAVDMLSEVLFEQGDNLCKRNRKAGALFSEQPFLTLMQQT